MHGYKLSLVLGLSVRQLLPVGVGKIEQEGRPADLTSIVVAVVRERHVEVGSATGSTVGGDAEDWVVL